jgi:hypothetical protein
MRVVFFQQVVTFAIAPIVIMAISFLIWKIIFFIKAKKASETLPIMPDSSTYRQSNTREKLTLDESRGDSDALRVLEQTKEEEQEGYIVSTIIIILFLLHPSIAKVMFNAFK